MSSFEFATVLISVIVGLAITHLLTGLGRAVHLRQRASLWWVHLCWTGTVFIYLALHWWNLFHLNDGSAWSFLAFVYLLLHSVLLFLLAVLLYRPDPEGAIDLRATFEGNRTWFFGVLTATWLADVGTTAIQGNLLSSWYYLPLAGHYAVLAAIGAYTANSRFHGFLAIYFLACFICWSVFVEGPLPGVAGR